MYIIAFSGYARAGKDEAAKVLVNQYGFRRIAYADKLRAALYTLNPIVSYVVWRDGDGNRILPTEDTYVTLQNVIDTYGWDGYKASEYGPEIRRLIQHLGTEVARDILGENVWVDAALRNVGDDEKIVITDCRFPNEAQAVKDRGGYVVRIERPGVGPASDHPSEHALKDWNFDFTIFNGFSNTEDYHEHVRQFLLAVDEHNYFENVIGEV